jgi:asparagine N-glycosylation enzyme membrane subunit Stt3
MGLFFTIVAGIVVGGVALLLVLQNLEKFIVGGLLLFGLAMAAVAILIILAFWEYLGTVPNGRSDAFWLLLVGGPILFLYFRAERRREGAELEDSAGSKPVERPPAADHGPKPPSN